MKTMSHFVILTMVLAAGTAFGSDCVTNYKASGSYRQGKIYTTWADLVGLAPAAALQNISTHLASEGTEIVSTDAAAGTLSALAKMGTKVAPIEVKTEAADGAARVYFSIDLPRGTFANAATKATVCRFVELARVDPAARYQHQLVTFVRTNSSDDEKVGVVESSARKRATKVALGALGGALVGALHAKVTGGDVAEGAAIGAVAGGVMTFAVTKLQDRRLASREEVMRAESYEPAQGYRTGIRSISVTPATVSPGEKITIVTTYWALAPAADVHFGVHRYAGLLYTGDVVRGFRFNPEPFRFAHGGGEYETTIELEIPAAAIPGSYSVQWVLDGQSTGADESAAFRIAG